MGVQGYPSYTVRIVPYGSSPPMADLSRKKLRDALPVRREPHWQRLAEGAYLGFRRGPDTWIARYRGRDGRQQFHALAGVLPNDYDEAKRRAEEWLVQMGAAGVRSAQGSTVRTALEAYMGDLIRHGRDGTADNAETRYRTTVWGDPLADIPLGQLTRNDVLDWRDRIREGREPRTVNRYVRWVTGGLNRALELGHVGNPRTWKLKRLADEREDEGTAVFLTPPQRKALLAAASLHACDFFRGLELTGARPGELAKAKVEDFDGEQLKLAHRKGNPPRLRVRHVVLSEEGIAHFRRAARDKHPQAYLFTEDGERAWEGYTWAREIRAAIARHNEGASDANRLPLGLGAYVFRHARISELLQVYGIDPLTVAMQTGTSLQMIENTYLKFIPSAMREKLAAVRES
jgi:integrase